MIKKLFFIALISFSFVASASHVIDVTKFTLRDGVKKSQCHLQSSELQSAIDNSNVDENGIEIVKIRCMNTVKQAFDDVFVEDIRQNAE